MSLLQRKLVQTQIHKNSLPINPEATGLLFAPLLSIWAKQCENLCGQEITEMPPSKGLNISQGQLKQLTQNAHGLFYAFGQADKPCQLFLEIPDNLSTASRAHKLNQQEPDKTALGLFDLILMQGLAETAGRWLSEMEILPKGTEISGRCIGAEALNRSGIDWSRRDDWLCISFPFTGAFDFSVKLYSAPPITQSIQSIQEKLLCANRSASVFDPSDAWALHWHHSIMSSRQRLDVVIEDIKMSVAECSRFELGQIIDLPGASHNNLNVIAPMEQGAHILSTARLGVFKANKAVKLHEDIDANFMADFMDLIP